MKYFKIIVNNTIVGAITSNDFMRYLPITDCFVRANEQNGEYATYKGNFYRSTWMHPITQNANYIDAQIIAIDEEEYNTYTEALAVHEIIINDEPQEEEHKDNYDDPIDRLSIEFIRESKIQEMSYACRQTIEAGFDLALRGEAHHFSLTTQDQLNLMSLSAMTQKQNLIPYHADGEECIFYTGDEINLIVETAANLKMYQTTYFNSLKNYINALDTIQAIAAIEYGILIPDEYKSDALKMLEM